MPTIEFRTYDEKSFELFRPVAAKEFQPDWWKKMKIRVDHRGRLVQTIRSCPAMQDWLTMGYYIVSTKDIPIRNGKTWDWPDHGEEMQTSEENSQVSASHPSGQLADSVEYLGADGPVKDAFKISSYWNMKTPPGYSVLFLDPFLFQNKYFACWQGVIDTDGFNVGLDNGQIIFYPRVDHSFTIPAGTPMCQVFPFKREEWASTFFYADSKQWFNEHAVIDSSMQKWQRDLQLVDEETGLPNNKLNIGGYRNAKIWKPKSKYFKKPEEIHQADITMTTEYDESDDLEAAKRVEIPPECPMHKDEDQMEMDFERREKNDEQLKHEEKVFGAPEKDFKIEQKKITDLNWDGQEDGS